MKVLALLLSLLIVLDAKTDYSIESFINYLQEKGYYNLLVEIKRYYGKDVAIDVCREIIQSKDCETLIKIYIQNGSRGHGEDMKTLEFIIFNPDNYELYKDKYQAIHNFIEKLKVEYNIQY